MANIFISYRRNDAGGHAGRLCDHLNAHLGNDKVFMDVEDIQPGQDFVRAIDDTVANCDYLLVLIGPRWLEMMEQSSGRHDDFVHREILAGLGRGITVIPVLVAGARMPEARRLPSDLAELSRRNAIEIRDDRFDDDVARLIEFLNVPSLIKDAKPLPFSRRRVFAGAVVIAVMVVAGIMFIVGRTDAPEISGAWMAEMQKPGQPSYRISMTLIQVGSTLRGVVNYPTGDGQIQEGTVDKESLIFSTLHTPQFESSPAVIHLIGKIERDSIHLTLTDDAGVATGVAHRKISP